MGLRRQDSPVLDRRCICNFAFAEACLVAADAVVVLPLEAALDFFWRGMEGLAMVEGIEGTLGGCVDIYTPGTYVCIKNV